MDLVADPTVLDLELFLQPVDDSRADVAEGSDVIRVDGDGDGHYLSSSWGGGMAAVRPLAREGACDHSPVHEFHGLVGLVGHAVIVSHHDTGHLARVDLPT